MIFVALGTQKFQFNRILIEIDNLIEEGKIKEEVFAQIGHSTYQPKNYQYKQFLNPKDFDDKIQSCDIFISHGGVGSITGGLKNNKKIIACPRLKKFDEHIDDHQLEICEKYSELGYVVKVDETTSLIEAISKAKKIELNKFFFNKNGIEHIEKKINEYIELEGKRD